MRKRIAEGVRRLLIVNVRRTKNPIFRARPVSLLLFSSGLISAAFDAACLASITERRWIGMNIEMMPNAVALNPMTAKNNDIQ